MRAEELQLHPANITEHSTHRLTCPLSFQAHVLSGYRTRKKILFYRSNILIFELDGFEIFEQHRKLSKS